ncbi:MAG: hypothetical protein AAFP84_11630 [Actinomycetota bacterium]
MRAGGTGRMRRRVAGLIVLAACRGGDPDQDAVPTNATDVVEATTTDVSAPTTSDEPVERTSLRNADEPAYVLSVTASERSIWMTTDSDRSCSPAEPAVSLIEATVLDGDGHDADLALRGMRAEIVPVDPDAEPGANATDDDGSDATTFPTTTTTTTSPAETTTTTERARRTRTIELARGDDGVWRGVAGPFEASRNSTDRTVAVRVRALPEAGEELSADAPVEIEILAPERCAGGRTRRDRTPDPGSLTVRTDPADGVIVASRVADCAGRPTELRIGVEVSGAVIAVTATGTLPDGSTTSRSFSGRGRDFRLTLGPFRGGSGLPESTPFSFEVIATDIYGRTSGDRVAGRLVRPEPCADGATPTTTTGGPDDPVDPIAPDEPIDAGDLAISFTPDPPQIWALATGRCPAGPTTLGIDVMVPGGADSVRVNGRSGNGQTQSATLRGSGSRWSGSLGPFDAWADMTNRTDLDVQVVAERDGRSASRRIDARLRRPDPCTAAATTTTTTATTVPASTTTAPTTAAPTTAPTTVAPTTAAPTTAAPTTAAPTTAAPTTAAPTTAPPPPAQITTARANPNPVACGASFTIGAQTSGAVDRVGASIGGGFQPLSGGGGSWSRNFTAPSTRQQLTVTVRAEGPSGDDQRSFTLNVDC